MEKLPSRKGRGSNPDIFMMTDKIKQIKHLIKTGESETTEFKESFGTDAIESLCALANTQGGVILIGLKLKSLFVWPTKQKGVPSLSILRFPNCLRNWNSR